MTVHKFRPPAFATVTIKSRNHVLIRRSKLDTRSGSQTVAHAQTLLPLPQTHTG